MIRIAAGHPYTSPVRRRAPLLLLVLTLVAAACGGSGDTTTTTAPPPSSAAAPTTTAAPGATGASPTPRRVTTTTAPIDLTTASLLNGLPADDPAALDRRVMAIKIDNHANARPQSGLPEADAVFEIRVEGGLTRFIALFHDNDTAYLGPVRSGRPTDGSVVAPLGAPFVISGAQPWVSRFIAQLGVETIGEVQGTYRVRGRSAPHNLYADTVVLRSTADGRGYADEPPARWFRLGEFDGPPNTAGEVVLDWSDSTTVTWRWDGERYLRWHDGAPHEWVDADGNRGQVAADVLIVVEGTLYTAYDPAGAGSAVPATETVGEGRALVFADGRAAEGVWRRDSAQEMFELFTADGEPLEVPPGVPWVSVFPNQREVTWSFRVPDLPKRTTTTTVP